jgi:hypothetical protein
LIGKASEMGVVAGRFFCYGNELGFSCRYVSVSGFHGVLAGFLVAVKQIMPDQEVSVLFKLHAKMIAVVTLRDGGIGTCD